MIKVYSREGSWRIDFPNGTGVLLGNCHGVTPIEKVWFEAGRSCQRWYNKPVTFEDIKLFLVGGPQDE